MERILVLLPPSTTLISLLLVVEGHDTPIELSSPEQAIAQAVFTISRRQGATAWHPLLENASAEPGMDHRHGAADARFVCEI